MALWPLGPHGNSLVFSQEAQPPAPSPAHPLAGSKGAALPTPLTGAVPAQHPRTHSYSSTVSSTSDMASSSLCRERDSPGGQRASHPALREAPGLPSPSPGPAAPGPRPCQAQTPSQQGQATGSTPLDRLLDSGSESLACPGLFLGSGLVTGRNPQGQPTLGAKLRAHGHREGPLHAVPSVKLSAPPRGRHGGRSRAMGPVEAGGTRRGHAAVEPPKAAVWWLHRHTGKRAGAHPHTQSHTHRTPQTHTTHGECELSRESKRITDEGMPTSQPAWWFPGGPGRVWGLFLSHSRRLYEKPSSVELLLGVPHAAVGTEARTQAPLSRPVGGSPGSHTGKRLAVPSL